MKESRKLHGEFKLRKPFFYFIFLLLLFFSAAFCFSTLRLSFTGYYHPQLVTWRSLALEVVSGESPAIPYLLVEETVIFPDQAVLFLKYPPPLPFFTKDDMECVYLLPSNSSHSQLKLPPTSIDGQYLDHQIVRCPLPPRGFSLTIALKSNGKKLSAGPTYKWDALAYEALIDRDNTTLVFVKGLNLRSGVVASASRFECVYGLDFASPNQLLLKSDVVSVAQEIVRCKTPLSVLNRRVLSLDHGNPMKASVRVVGRGIMKSIARPRFRMRPDLPAYKQHEMCICTMIRNQVRFLKEWVMYHSRIGVQRWFIYDNNSDDNIDSVIELLNDNYNITRHVWPWIKTQEAGFAHCALRARGSCEWVGFIDVDEFFHFPSNLSLHDILNNNSRPNEVAELRTSCHSFGPSGLTRAPVKGVMVGYTCRVAAPERHKSIVKPEALNTTLINMVHHFHLRDGFKHEYVDRNVMVINHYKYQVWEVFKEKFYRRVATYVFDWQQEKNVRSKDRVPGLGTRPVEPPDWSTRFCQVTDTNLRDRVVRVFGDTKTGMLPWQDEQE